MCPKMPTRRNLCDTLPPKSPLSISKAQSYEEGLLPLQCTPEAPHKTVQHMPPAPPGASAIIDPNMTFELLDNDQTVCNDTIIISTGSPGPSQGPHTGRAKEGSQFPLKR